MSEVPVDVKNIPVIDEATADLGEELLKAVHLNPPLFIIRSSDGTPVTPEAADRLHRERSDRIHDILTNDPRFTQEHFKHGVRVGPDDVSQRPVAENGLDVLLTGMPAGPGSPHTDRPSSLLNAVKTSEPLLQAHTTRQVGGNVQSALLAPTGYGGVNPLKVSEGIDRRMAEPIAVDPDHIYQDPVIPGDTLVHRAGKTVHRFDSDGEGREALVRSFAAIPGEQAPQIVDDTAYRQKHGLAQPAQQMPDQDIG